MDRNELFQEYEKLFSKKKFVRQSIDGLLNRISVTDDEEERNRIPKYLSELIIEYVNISRETHSVIKELEKSFGRGEV